MKLHIYRRDTLERTLDLTGGDLRIGRGTENDLVLDDADKTVSRFHAELRQEQDEITLIDLHSENGTWIDGQRIQHATLSPGTTIAMGHFRLVLEEHESDAARARQIGAAENEFAPLPIMIGQAHRGSSGTPASSSSSRAETPSSGHADAAMMAMAAAAGANANAGAAGASGAIGGAHGAGASSHRASTPRAGAAPVTAHRSTGAASIPRPVLYAGCLVVVVLLVGIPYVFWPHAEEGGARGVGSGTAEAAGADAQGGARGGNRAGAANGGARASQGGNGSAAGVAGASAGVGRTAPGGSDANGAAAGDDTSRTTPGGAGQPGVASGAGSQAAATQPIGSPASGAPGASTQPAMSGAPAAGAQLAAAQGGAPTLTSVASGSAGSSAPANASASNAAAPAASTRPLTRAERAALAKREQAAANLYARGKAALAAGNFAEATTAFESVMREKPNHLDTATLLEQARSGVRDDALKVASQASALAAKGDFRGAIRDYERARQIDPALEAASSGIADVRAKMKVAGDDAYRRARQLEAVGRMQDATANYTRAADLLPADDANGKAARERLEAITRQP